VALATPPPSSLHFGGSELRRRRDQAPPPLPFAPSAPGHICGELGGSSVSGSGGGARVVAWEAVWPR
jgi:hypothetical protein